MSTQAVPTMIPGPPAPAGTTPRRRGRDRYIDSLRAVALIRVVAYHTFGWILLPIIFPSMGVMFALAGSLVAASLDKSPMNPWRVLKNRLRRLLPPLWAMGLLLVPVMWYAGWTFTEKEGVPFEWQTLLFWILPLSDPPGSALGDQWVLTLWYIRTYLWFVLLAPMTLWLFRHWPKRMIAIPLAVVLLHGVGIVPLFDRGGDIILQLAIFGACWMLGYAHHDDMIRRIPLQKVFAIAGVCIAFGLWWTMQFPDPETGRDIANIPVADAFYSLGFVLLLLRFYPDFSWMTRYPWLDKLVAAINRRAMTIYLWGNVSIFLAIEVVSVMPVIGPYIDDDRPLGLAAVFVVTWLFIASFIVVLGWIEDVAARRKAQLNPFPKTPAVSAAPKLAPPSGLPVAPPSTVHQAATVPPTPTVPTRSTASGRHDARRPQRDMAMAAP